MTNCGGGGGGWIRDVPVREGADRAGGAASRLPQPHNQGDGGQHVDKDMQVSDMRDSTVSTRVDNTWDNKQRTIGAATGGTLPKQHIQHV